jgi:hypothetical protein
VTLPTIRVMDHSSFFLACATVIPLLLIAISLQTDFLSTWLATAMRRSSTAKKAEDYRTAIKRRDRVTLLIYFVFCLMLLAAVGEAISLLTLLVSGWGSNRALMGVTLFIENAASHAEKNLGASALRFGGHSVHRRGRSASLVSTCP